MTALDKASILARYQAERDKRLRDDGNDQYIEIAGQYAHYLEDPYTPVTPRSPVTDHVTFAMVGGGFAGLCVGARLVQACVDHARAERSTGILLIGDPPYFSRFGFVQAEDVRLSGPVDPRRLLWLPVTRNTPEGLVAPLI